MIDVKYTLEYENKAIIIKFNSLGYRIDIDRTEFWYLITVSIGGVALTDEIITKNTDFPDINSYPVFSTLCKFICLILVRSSIKVMDINDIHTLCNNILYQINLAQVDYSLIEVESKESSKVCLDDIVNKEYCIVDRTPYVYILDSDNNSIYVYDSSIGVETVKEIKVSDKIYSIIELSSLMSNNHIINECILRVVANIDACRRYIIDGTL